MDKNVKENKETRWNSVENYFATQVIEQAKTSTKRWFIAWLITLAALFVTNGIWIYVFNSYEYAYQDSEGMNNINTGSQGDVVDESDGEN